MRHAGTLLSVVVFIFWALMNGLLVERELRLRKLGGLQRGVRSFLGPDLRRERWMSIWRGSRKVGYTGFTFEKVFAAEGVEYRGSLETVFTGGLPFQGILSVLASEANGCEIRADLVLDRELRPSRLQVDITATLLEGTVLAQTHRGILSGKREEDRLRVTVAYQGRQLGELALPLKTLTLSDGLAPSVPLSGYQVGDTFRVDVFDPLTLGLGGGTATVRVVAQEPRAVEGILVDTFLLETEYRGATLRSWVTTGGEVVRQELGPPLHLVLRRERSREVALRGIVE